MFLSSDSYILKKHPPSSPLVSPKGAVMDSFPIFGSVKQEGDIGGKEKLFINALSAYGGGV